MFTRIKTANGNVVLNAGRIIAIADKGEQKYEITVDQGSSVGSYITDRESANNLLQEVEASFEFGGR
ncbi:MAG TPA: hypothetical protein VFX30_02280 [bacterium]|nr:hypothetical protein [bacterium]